MIALVVHKGGACASIQDLGRWGYRHIGVSLGGAMDRTAARLANLLVGNCEGAAVLEVAMHGTEVYCTDDVVVAVCGADLDVSVASTALPLDRPVFVPAGKLLRFQAAQRGNFAYLAVAGGFDIPVALGGRGTHLQSHFGGFHGRALRAGDRVPLGPPSERNHSVQAAVLHSTRCAQVAFAGWGAAIALTAPADQVTVIRVLPGLHFAQLTEASQKKLWSIPFRISIDCDRMGFRLEGPPLTFKDALQIPSMPTLPGTIQLPVGGSPIVLMADASPTGGYPQIGHVIAVDLPLLAQTKPGEQIRFEMTSHAAALQARRTREVELRRLALAIEWRTRAAESCPRLGTGTK